MHSFPDSYRSLVPTRHRNRCQWHGSVQSSRTKAYFLFVFWRELQSQITWERILRIPVMTELHLTYDEKVAVFQDLPNCESWTKSKPTLVLVCVKGLLEHSVPLHLSIHCSCFPAPEPELENTREDGSLQYHRRPLSTLLEIVKDTTLKPVCPWARIFGQHWRNYLELNPNMIFSS